MAFQAGAIIGELRLNARPFTLGIGQAEGASRSFLSSFTRLSVGMAGGLSVLIFVRRGFNVYIIDQPRQGKAGRSTKGSVALSDPVPSESNLFNTFRFGQWLPARRLQSACRREARGPVGMLER